MSEKALIITDETQKTGKNHSALSYKIKLFGEEYLISEKAWRYLSLLARQRIDSPRNPFCKKDELEPYAPRNCNEHIKRIRRQLCEVQVPIAHRAIPSMIGLIISDGKGSYTLNIKDGHIEIQGNAKLVA